MSTGRALLLAFIYVQGMALTYTALGLVVAAAGLQFQAALQHPYVLIGLAIVFTLLALSMFGLFTLQLPSSLQTRLTLMSNRQQGGSPGGVFCYGGDCRINLLALHYSAVKRDSALYRSERQHVAGRRHAVFVCIRYGSAANAGHRVWQPPVTEKRPVDGAC